MSPRRSSRARSSQLPPAPPSATASSSSTTTLKNPHATQRSESIEDPTEDASPATEPIMPRRSRRGNGDDTAKEPLPPEKQEEEEPEENLEEEVTRCICGQAEYPGPSPSVRELAGTDALADDLGNFFVQCDSCQAWLHGGCMGLIDESKLPEDFYCYECRPSYHKIVTGPHGMKSSRYRPVLDPTWSRSSSLSSNRDPSERKDSKQSESTKRRATMNSRGAYDEDEMLRRAIEESKIGSLKRSREGMGDDERQAVKRQRTASTSPSSGTKRSHSPSMAVDEGSTRAGSNKTHQRLRAVVGKSKEKEVRDKQKEQTAALRAEAASKRNARSERRRGDDSPPPTPSLSPSKMAAAMAAQFKVKADTPPLNRATTKGRTGRPARRGRLGRNQYTRDQPTNGDTSDTPMRDTSQEGNGNSNGNGHGGSPSGANGINGESGRSSKAKTHPARTSMNEMKRRVAAILEFVGRMQTERGVQSQQSSGSASSKGANTPNGGAGTVATNLPTATLVKAVQEASEEVENADGAAATVKMREDKDFAGMASAEMMETLAKELVMWQSVYGFYSR